MSQTATRRKWVSYSKAAGIIRQMIVEGSHAPAVLDKSREIVLCVSRNPASQAQALWYYVAKRITYIEDPYNDDHFQAPEITMRLRCGDCDDQVILLGSLLRSVGFETRLVFVFKDRPKDYSADFPEHVYLQVNVERDSNAASMWVDVDTVDQPGYGGNMESALYGRFVPVGFREYVEIG